MRAVGAPASWSTSRAVRRACAAGRGSERAGFDLRPIDRDVVLGVDGCDGAAGPSLSRAGRRAAVAARGRRDQRLEDFRHLDGRSEAIVGRGWPAAGSTIRTTACGTLPDRTSVIGTCAALGVRLTSRVTPGQAGEGVLPREQPVHRASEAEEVRPRIDRFGRDLFGRHEIGRSDHDAFVGVEDVARLPRPPDHRPAAEVEHLDRPRVGEEQVGGLDVLSNT